MYKGTSTLTDTAQKICKYGGFFLTVFGSKMGLYGPEKAPYLDTFYAVRIGAGSFGNSCQIFG